jgi:hypothetical protein
MFQIERASAQNQKPSGITVSYAKTLRKFLVASTLAACVVAIAKTLLFPLAGSSFEELWSALSILLFWHWLYFDAVDQRYHRPLSFGMQLQAFWWLSVPVYLLETRGKRGLLVIVAMLAAMIGPSLCSVLTALVLEG